MRHTKVELGEFGIFNIELTATDSVWTTVDGLPPEFGGLHILKIDRSLPSHVYVKGCRFDGQVRYASRFALILTAKFVGYKLCRPRCVTKSAEVNYHQLGRSDSHSRYRKSLIVFQDYVLREAFGVDLENGDN